MATYYDDFRSCQTVDDLKLKLNRFFESFFTELDSLNITSLNTNVTNISSGDSTTVINGSKIEMYDKTGVGRLFMGNDGTNFVFQMNNASGIPTLSIDSNGNAVYSGTINASSFNGGTIAIGSGNNVFKADGNGIYLGNASYANAPFKVSMTGTVTASNMNITGGSISWSAINSDPDIAIAQNTANNANNNATSALTTAQKIANGTYNGGTFINGTTIYAPLISGAVINGVTINGGKINVNDDVKIGDALFINNSSYQSGIFWSDNSSTNDPSTSGSIYADPGMQHLNVWGHDYLTLEAGSNFIDGVIYITADSVVVGDNIGSSNVYVCPKGRLSFYGVSPISRQSAGLLSTPSSYSYSAGSTYTATTASMLNALKSDVGKVFSKLNGIMHQLENVGLITTY